MQTLVLGNCAGEQHDTQPARTRNYLVILITASNSTFNIDGRRRCIIYSSMLESSSMVDGAASSTDFRRCTIIAGGGHSLNSLLPFLLNKIQFFSIDC